MQRLLPIAVLALLLPVSPRARGGEPAPAPEREIASLVPEHCPLYVDATGLLPTFRRGLQDPLVQALISSAAGRRYLSGTTDRAPEALLRRADDWFGRPVLPALVALAQRGLALGMLPGSEQAVLVLHGEEPASVRRTLEELFDRLELALGWPGALDEPREYWHGADVYMLGDDLVVARREAVLAVGNAADLVRQVLALAADPGGRGLLARPAFTAAHGQRTRREHLWAWADLERLGSADRGLGELRGWNRSPSVQSLFGPQLAALASSRILSGWLSSPGGAGIELGLRGSGARSAEVLLPAARSGALVPPAPDGGEALAQALLYRDYAGIFAHRRELFPPETLPAFAEQISNAALFFGGQDIGQDLWPRISPWFRMVARAPQFSPGLEPELPLPAVALIAGLEEPERTGPELIAAFQSLISVSSMDQAQKGRSGMKLELAREGEAELTSARFLPPRAGDGVDVRYNLQPACGLVDRWFVLGTHESLVREVLRDLATAPESPESIGSGPCESLLLAGEGLAEFLARNEEFLVVQKMLEEGLARPEAEEEIEGLRLIVASVARLEVELRPFAPGSWELLLHADLGRPAEPAR